MVNIGLASTRVGGMSYDVIFNSSSLQYRLIPQFATNFANVWLRGTHNDWRADNSSRMQLVDDHLWEAEVYSSSYAGLQLKFDIFGDWSQNYGDNTGDGIADRGGANIIYSPPARSSSYLTVWYNDATGRYSVIQR